jgi:2-polyprenyl-3-methyl-5-hydroxy-6-metoxy-1,4-benzoquinol methylase
MLDSLTSRLTGILDRLRGFGRLTEENIQEALREVRVALLEADVNFKVVKTFVERVRVKAVGLDVLQSLTPGQQVVKVVRDELVELLGGSGHRLAMAPHPPTVIMLVGLQGSGKTTTTAKLAKRLSSVIESFRRGGGVPYSDFRPDFTEAQDASWRLLYDGLLIKGFLPAVKGLPERLQDGIRVADLGCGTGHAVNLMAREYPASDFVGYDFGEDAIERGQAEARAMGLGNARFKVMDVARLPDEPKFDLVTSFDAIHDQRDPAAVLRRAAAVLAPGGVYVMMEPRASSNLEDNIGNPFTPYMYAMSVLHCMTVSLAAGGAGLGTAWGEQTARRMLGEAGFKSVEVVEAPGPQNSIYICRT